MIAANLRKIKAMPRYMMSQFMGDKYVTISNIDIGVCQTLAQLASVQSDPYICESVRAGPGA